MSPLSDADTQALERMKRLTPRADPISALPDIPPSKIPRHVAIIMDGNGRWARQRNLPHTAGHRQGGKTLRTIVKACSTIGIECLTVYAFSKENWKRPKEEIDALMDLCVAYCQNEQAALIREGVRVRVIGQLDTLPHRVETALNELMDATAHITGPTLCLAINYGSRDEITRACAAIAREVKEGTLDLESITEQLFDEHLDTAGLPEIDLMIRTAGEMRLSNFLLWQLSYAELYVTDTLWPDFGTDDFYAAIRSFAGRTRRFGARLDAE